MSLLHTESMSVTFGGLHAVNKFDLEVRQGLLVGLIGPNGAGKTTFIDGATGFVRTTGRIVFDGHDISGLPVHKRAELGLGRTWQSLELFDDLTVEENLFVAADQQTTKNFLLDLVRPSRKQSPKRRTRARRSRHTRSGDPNAERDQSGPTKTCVSSSGSGDRSEVALYGRTGRWP
jgi:ABC-type branched-subunit amino acid transport system ATPase component